MLVHCELISKTEEFTRVNRKGWRLFIFISILTGLFQLQGIIKVLCNKLVFSSVFPEYLIQNFNFCTLINFKNKLFHDSVDYLPFFLYVVHYL